MNEPKMKRQKKWQQYETKRKIFKFIYVCIFIVIAAVVLNSQSFKRQVKSLQSNYMGGLNRTVTVYDNNGNKLRSWEGKLDIKDTSFGNKVVFDLNGKRKTLYNAVVIVEEK